MSLSRNEMNTIKKAIKESIQTYVDIKIANAQYAFTEIATVTAEHWDDLSNDIEVKGKATYTHVISVGKIVYPVGSVVYCFIPNNQYNNMFILGKLDKVPAQITGGTIGIGRIGTTEPPQYSFYVDANGNVTITKGSINLGNGNFVVDNQGNTTIRNGDVNITSGNLHIGWNFDYNDYNFAVENDGSMRAYNGNFYGYVSASSGNFGKFNINVTDGLLDYEDPAKNAYVYLGKNIANGCGLVVSEVPFGNLGSKVSIAPQGIETISEDGNNISQLTSSMLQFENLNSSEFTTIEHDGITLEGGDIRFKSDSHGIVGMISDVRAILFKDASGVINGTEDEIYFYKQGAIWKAGAGSNAIAILPSCRSVNESFKNVKTCTDEIRNQLGITVELSGGITLSTSPTSANFLSNSSKGQHTTSYGHSLSLPASGNSSDIRLKEQISEMPNIEDLYNQIKLYKFKYHSDIVDADDRFHWGIIAQEVDELFQSNGYTDKDFSLVYKSKQNVGYNEDKYVGEDKVFRVLPNEFNAMHVQMIQKLWKRCDELEKEIKELKERKGN